MSSLRTEPPLDAKYVVAEAGDFDLRILGNAMPSRVEMPFGPEVVLPRHVLANAETLSKFAGTFDKEQVRRSFLRALNSSSFSSPIFRRNPTDACWSLGS